ncbi:hypothetical protein BJX61DRAFT_93801 [Aspergillus egyptiacus]|nr:hypothetical protein BJX61DRAFT_93801 [Aspergillus egyptiacus]
MIPVPQSEADRESHTSEMASQDSPLRRKFSEPIHANSTTSAQTTPSPPPVSQRSKCDFCGKLFETSSDISGDEALKKHIAAVHPHIVNGSTYDGATDQDEESQIDDDEDDEEDEDMPIAQENGSHRTVNSHEDENSDGAEDELVEASEVYDDGKERSELDKDDAGLGADGEVPEGESDVALSNQLHEFSREQDSASLEKRLHNFWNLHDVRRFSEDYDESTEGMTQRWKSVFHDSKRKRSDAPELQERPNPYKKSKVGRGEFLEITPLEEFLAQLRDPEMRSTEELYAITENAAYALKVWQDEFLAIDRLHKQATRHQLKQTSDPRKFERHQVFEDKKEAMLYGYKHDPKEDKVGHQNPFLQGGFKPTVAQYRKMAQKAGPNNPNPDGWPIIMRFDVEHVPKFQDPPREEFVGKATRKRKAAELEAANRANDSEDAAATETPAPNEPDQEHANPAKRRARTRRQAADAEPGESGNARTSSTRGRGGRARGRGTARVGSRAGSEAPLAPAPPAGGTPARSTPAADGPTQARPGPSQLVPIEPAPNGTSAAVSTPNPLLGGTPDEALDPAELARRQKIANSKNPKRTEAMLNHWARFNREGRVRNPKRSKAQIEADKAAEAARKAAEGPKPIGKKKKSTSPVVPTPPSSNAGIAPAPPTIPAPPTLAPGPHPHQHPHQHPLPPPPPHPHPHQHAHPHPHPQPQPQPQAHPHTHTHTHTPQLPPIASAPARGPLAPYPPPHLDPRAVAPFPPGPRGHPHLQPPPQPYRTPYPDYFSSYGGTGLPPPGYPRP